MYIFKFLKINALQRSANRRHTATSFIVQNKTPVFPISVFGSDFIKSRAVEGMSISGREVERPLLCYCPYCSASWYFLIVFYSVGSILQRGPKREQRLCSRPGRRLGRSAVIGHTGAYCIYVCVCGKRSVGRGSFSRRTWLE